ncbi:MAG: glycosyltransferase family 2 protein [Anaerolineales bacterium]|nr:glycosyltransferase family 2 protein [Anaerolineales bacterium]
MANIGRHCDRRSINFGGLFIVDFIHSLTFEPNLPASSAPHASRRPLIPAHIWKTILPNPLLSIIIPAHNEEHRLPQTLEQVFAFLQAQDYSAEVIIVENGSHDHTFEIAQSYAQQYANCRVLQEQTPGKGLAVKKGMLAARGEYRFMCDADLSMPIVEVNRFIPPQLNDFEIAIASREAPGAVRYNEPEYRHLGGRAINLIIRLLALPSLNDTQCGFKCFRAPVAEDIFNYQTLTGWAFDIELLYIARRRGYRMCEIPIPWYFNPDTKLSPIWDALRMVLDIFAIHRNALQGRYNAQKI